MSDAIDVEISHICRIRINLRFNIMKNRFLIFDIGRSLFKLKIYRVSIASYCLPLSLEKGRRIAEEEAQLMVIYELMTRTENADHQETDTFHDHLVEETLVF